jgi:hypothetical protein
MLSIFSVQEKVLFEFTYYNYLSFILSSMRWAAEGYLRIIPRYRAYSTMRPNANMARSGVG